MPKKIISLTLIILFAVVALSACTSQTPTPPENQEAMLWLFYDPGCPHCHDEQEFLENMQIKYPEFTMAQFNVSVRENSKLYAQMAQAYSLQTGGVPVTYIGGQAIVGYADYIGEQIEEQIQKCLEVPCASPGDKLQ